MLSAESDQGGMTHPGTSMKDSISSLQTALVSAFKSRDPLRFSRQQLKRFNNTEFQKAVLSQRFSCSR